MVAGIAVIAIGEEFLYCVKAAGNADGNAASGRACGLRPVPPCAAPKQTKGVRGAFDPTYRSHHERLRHGEWRGCSSIDWAKMNDHLLRFGSITAFRMLRPTPLSFCWIYQAQVAANTGVNERAKYWPLMGSATRDLERNGGDFGPRRGSAGEYAFDAPSRRAHGNDDPTGGADAGLG